MSGGMRGPRSKIVRAKRHIQELEASLSGLTISRTTHPNVIVTEDDPETGNLLYKILRVPCVPDQIGAIAGDAIHNLRSSLDLLMSQLVEDHTGKPPSSHLYYPSAGDRKTFVAGCEKQIEPLVGEDAFKLILASETYRRGRGDAAWRVHRLDIEDKHRVVYELGFNLTSQTLAFPSAAFVDLGLDPEVNDAFDRRVGEIMDTLYWRPGDKFFPLKDDDVLFSGPQEPTNDPKFRLDVAFSKPKIVETQPILPTITQFSEATESLVESFAGILDPAQDEGS
jgi:hypothetical protein